MQRGPTVIRVEPGLVHVQSTIQMLSPGLGGHAVPSGSDELFGVFFVPNMSRGAAAPSDPHQSQREGKSPPRARARPLSGDKRCSLQHLRSRGSSKN